MLYRDRQDAGKKLAHALLDYQDDADAIILALPRGGVVLGFELHQMLHLPLDLILVRKLGVPGQEELALGAISLDDVKVINKGIVSMLSINEETIAQIMAKEQQELTRRNLLYRENKPFPALKDKVVILVDDGIATGATMRAAINVVKELQPRKIVVATPVASSSVYSDLRDEHVEVEVLATPEPFYGIGMWYGDFKQITDEEVIHLVKMANQK